MGELVDTSGIGRWGAPFQRPVSSEELARYRAATNSAGVSPVFTYLVAQEAITAAILSVTGDLPRKRMLTAAMSFICHHPCLPGQTYTSWARPRRIEERRRGAALMVEACTTDQTGRHVWSIIQTAYLVGVTLQEPRGQPLPVTDLTAPAGSGCELSVRIDPDQPARFLAATGEDNPIHRDPAAARAAGLPGVILHGTCLLAMVVDGIARRLDIDPSGIRQMRVRFTAPVTPGQAVRTMLRPLGGGRWSFETIDEAGTVVLGHGLVTLEEME
jgi:acyl dehydratase